MEDIDLTDLDRFAHGFPHAVFDRLRTEEPVWWHPPTAHTPGGEGFWVISRYADIVAVAGDSDTYSSESGGQRSGGGTLIEDLPVDWAVGVLLNMMDDPRHAEVRRLLTPSVAPRTLKLIEDDLRQRAATIVDAALGKGDCDFLIDLAAELPLQAVAQLLGVPQEDRHQLFGWANVTLDYDDRDLGEATARSQAALAETRAYGARLLAAKTADPAEDLMSLAAHATIDGQPLTDMEKAMLFSLLIAAGSETTRNSIAVGMLALIERPEIWRSLRADRSRLDGAVEEMLRWASSTSYNRRTATRDTELGEQRIRAGDKVTLWWTSANRDEAVFPEPHRFDIGRRPNPHLAFGRGGHFCLGSNLARMEMRVLVDALLDRVETAELTGPVEYTRSNKHTGVRHMPVRLTPR
ncbi:Putative cytochrome P450 126 [Nocardia seriolae]|uniref:Cytochrome P450 n=1 Tax=Nocardia seriolae TaxID=37332 RepID=A0ABC8B6N6_9NOCA|nr:Putative cytochrome P450 126 [Nocardia seriolae]PSK28268.1 cytochrome P450 [Nocardia seriolae]QOW32847.1 cytochrome P450 [Nocardia seriolae]BEK92860.1 cytochrome P450 [Nocardia seriolae]GAM51284.1 cytochrome P450 [Nocardia seriolae]